MVGALASSGNPQAETWLDPCVGPGIFIKSINENCAAPEQLIAMDVSKVASQFDGLATTFRGTDFIAWASQNSASVDAIVANPPYVRNCSVPESLKTEIGRVFPSNTSSAGSNYWVAFMFGMLEVLRPGGRLCVVLPASWDYADYAKQLKTRIRKSFGYVREFRSWTPLFPDVEEGSVVVIAGDFGSANCEWSRSEHQSGSSLIRDLASFRASVTSEVKISAAESDHENEGKLFKEIATVSIGAVTGYASYFLITELQRTELGIPLHAVLPMLTRAKHIEAGEITKRDWNRLKVSGERVWMFRPDSRSIDDSHVQNYMKAAPDDLSSRSHVLRRPSWYQVTLPRLPHAFISGMAQSGPWLMHSRMRDLSASNTLYTVNFRENITQDERFAWSVSFLTSAARADLASRARIYAGGLMKLEPSDIMATKLPEWKDSTGSRAAYLASVKSLRAGDTELSEMIADTWITQSGSE